MGCLHFTPRAYFCSTAIIMVGDDGGEFCAHFSYNLSTNL
jgi:hypothetical protein